MHISSQEYKGFEIVEVGEDIDDKNLTPFENYLKEVSAKGSINVAINLSGCNRITSLAISVLIRTWKNLANLNGSLHVISSNKQINGLLVEYKINKIIPLYSSLQAFQVELDEDKGPVNLRLRQRGKYKIIDITQPISVTSGYHELDRKLNALISDGNRHIVFNLWSTDCFYSEIAGLINKWSWLLRRSGGEFCLLGLTKDVRERLKLLEFDKVVRFCDSEDDIK